MSYFGHLQHIATVERSSGTSRDESGKIVPNYQPVTTLTAIPCRLNEGVMKTELEAFGREVEADALVYFEPDTDIRPRPSDASPSLDKLIITDENSKVSTWLVMQALDPSSRRRLIVAAVKQFKG